MTSSTRYRCCNPRRLEALREAGTANAIDYVEVRDAEEPVEALKQRTLFVRMLHAQPVTTANVVIRGGEVVPTVPVTWVEWADVVAGAGVVGPGGVTPAEGVALTAGLTEPGNVLVVRTAARGDFSTYTLELLTPDHTAPLPGVDPLLASVEVGFKVECPSDLDCAPDDTCPPEQVPAPGIDYLAKDFDTFRRLMLDRLSLTTPGWTERNPADVGMVLVELLAYLGDELSYRQDAVATEAYLGTARRRPSLRRHARMVDYVVHEGCNARVWVRFEVRAEDVPFPTTVQLLTRVDGLGPVLAPGSAEHQRALAAGTTTFEPVDTAFAADDPDRAPLAAVLRPALHQSLNELDLYTWGDDDCCLPVGATDAALVGHHAAKLQAGHLLVLAEVAGPLTGVAADADPTRRCVVRLTSVVDSEDPAGGLFHTPPDAGTVPVTEISWHAEDALTFPLCLSDRHHPDLAVSKAWGNVVLADHGRSVPDLLAPAGTPALALGVVPEPVLTYAAAGPSRHCALAAADPDPGVGEGSGGGAAGSAGADAGAAARAVPVRFRPTVPEAPLTHAAPTPAAGAGGVAARLPSARASRATDPRRARPLITLHGERGDEETDWAPLPDLLSADGNDACFVVETEEDSTAPLRFGDNRHGVRPDGGTAFTARYRIGNGRAGNVGAGAVAHVVCEGGADILAVGNPLPATGGVDPEPAEAVRRDAPQAFTTQERAVTAADYAAVAERDSRVQRAAATFRWTGSWRTVFVTADRLGGDPAGGGPTGHAPTGDEQAFEASLRAAIEPYRMAGYDLEIDRPSLVSLDVELHVCVRPDVLRGPVRAAVLDALSSTVRSDGTPGFFHPDRFTFGQPVYLSAIVAAAQQVDGVESVTAVRFRRQQDDGTSGLDDGVLPMGRLEIARLANDPNLPGHGVLVVTAGGGL